MRTLFLISTLLINALCLASAPKEKAVYGEYLVKLKDGVEMSREVENFPFSVETWRPVGAKEGRVYKVTHTLIESTDTIFESLKANSNVEIVEPNFFYKALLVPNDALFDQLWGLNSNKSNHDINVEKAWDITTGSDNIVVAVIDTGVNYNHPDLRENMWVNTAELEGIAGVDDDSNGYIDDIHGYDFANLDADPNDDHGHGTHCAGTIGARGNNNEGVTGVAWHVKIMALKFLKSNGNGTLEGAIEATDYGSMMGVDVMNNSWGGKEYSELLKEAVERSEKAGVVFVAAAGNDRKNVEKNPVYPAAFDFNNVISVASITRAGNLSNFSNYSQKGVDIAAPGSSIFSTWRGQDYRTISGTSMAAPHVSGVAALLKAYDIQMDYAEVKDRILNSAKPLKSVKSKVLTGGMLNAFGALTIQ